MIAASPFDPPHHCFITVSSSSSELLTAQSSSLLCFVLVGFHSFLFKIILILQRYTTTTPIKPILSSLSSLQWQIVLLYVLRYIILHTGLPGPFLRSLFLMFLFNIHSLRWVEGIKPCEGCDSLLFFLLGFVYSAKRPYSVKFLKNSPSTPAQVNCCC